MSYTDLFPAELTLLSVCVSADCSGPLGKLTGYKYLSSFDFNFLSLRN